MTKVGQVLIVAQLPNHYQWQGQFEGAPATLCWPIAEGVAGPVDSDDRIIAPATAVPDHLSGYGNLSSISVKVTSSETVNDAQTQVESILDARLRTSADDRDFSVSNSASFLDAASSIPATEMLTDHGLHFSDETVVDASPADVPDDELEFQHIQRSGLHCSPWC